MPDGSDSLSGAGWRLNANFTHQWQMAYKRLMREGLPEVDLLSGGAGFGTGQSRHRVQATLGLAHKRHRHAAQLELDQCLASRFRHDERGPPALQLHVALRPAGVHEPGNRGSRQPAAAGRAHLAERGNLLDSKQRVQDQDGVTPLRYQPYLLNPLGRTVSLSFRKAFS